LTLTSQLVIFTVWVDGADAVGVAVTAAARRFSSVRYVSLVDA
jgi:hypothetical protein